MKLRVDRNWLIGDTTLGRLYVNDKFFAYTLEDKVRNEKIYGETAIPYGTYDVDLTNSPRFKRIMPLIKNVPGFQGIRIHSGSTNKDTAGCLLIGKQLSSDNRLLQSKVAFNELFSLLEKAKQNGEKITISMVAPDKKPILIIGVLSLSLLLVGGFFLKKAIKQKVIY